MKRRTSWLQNLIGTALFALAPSPLRLTRYLVHSYGGLECVEASADDTPIRPRDSFSNAIVNPRGV